MIFGALSFLNPWLLTALATLPLIYWLLRTVPPRPRQIKFPPTRILVGIENREKTPAKTPWWLLLIRLLAAALIIFALADPILNPSRGALDDGDGPMAIIVDNSWAAAPRWNERRQMIDQLIGKAQSQSRPVVVLGTAQATKSATATLQAPNQALTTARALRPHPFAPNRLAALDALEKALGKSAAKTSTATSVIWLTDGIDHDGKTADFTAKLSTLAKNRTFAVISDTEQHGPLAVSARVIENGRLSATLKRTGGPARDGTLTAFSARGENLGQTTFHFSQDQTSTTASFDIPLELRNQVTHIAIPGVRSAGAVSLLDARSQWHRIALISSEGAEQAQPILAPLYYIDKALSPFAQIIKPDDANLAAGIGKALQQKASVMILADIGTLPDTTHDKVSGWVEKGGILIRFAGPRMEQATDSLLPVALRIGGRTLGGALSWSTPQQLAPFEDKSLFAGLKVAKEVTVSRQVLAEPTQLTPNVKIWARLQDGTPLVTAARRGNGQIVLFHVTANSDWSNLPISGLFVSMLKRIVALATPGGIETSNQSGAETSATNATAIDATSGTLPPIETLNGYGELQPPPPTARAIPTTTFSKITPDADHPPGYYGTGATPRALNIATPDTTLAPMPPLPSRAQVRGYTVEDDTRLKPWLLAAALVLIFLDIIAILLMQSGGSNLTRKKAATTSAITALLISSAALTFAFPPPNAFAQEPPPGANTRSLPLDKNALQATAKVTLGYVLTGDPQTDNTSRLGLTGLGRILARRTSITPGEPIGVDILTDEIAFYPVLYWPISQTTGTLPDPALAKIDAFMKQGGLIIFDTKDYGQGLPAGIPQTANRVTPLQRLLGQLDIPRLEPVPAGHVLTKSFYLLHEFPGRWSGGQLWVEAGSGMTAGGDKRPATRTDGVTSIMITSNDFAAAWALDERGRPIFPTVSSGGRQREMAFRTGVNIVMHALTGNYKADQVHVPSLLQRLGQ